jgi:RimJ/RimL family protein N-acetyltransferase
VTITPSPGSPYPSLVVADAGRLRIRHKHRDDFPQDYAWRIDPEIARFDGREPPTLTFDEFTANAERELLFGSPGRASFSIESAEGPHIGNVMYYNATADGSAELGISLGAASSRDNGLGTLATITFLRFLWATTPLRRLWLHTLTWNERAQACFRRAGFSDVELVLHNGEPHLRMECRREWWLLWDTEGRFDLTNRPRTPTPKP